MHSIRRSCQSALRNSDNACIYAIGSRRAFSGSSARSRGALPVFLEASKPELSSLLAALNSKILLPCHLTSEQQKLVYKSSNRAKLEAEPVEITLGDVTIPLENLDRNTLPPRWPTFSTIVRQSETREDYENVVRMLEGFENAGIKLDADKHAFVVRRLNLAGMQHLILKALQRPQATGLRMREWPVMLQILRSAHDKAAMADWDEEETKKALRLAKQMVELLEDEEHYGGQKRGEKAAEQDFRGKPAVIAVPTGLAAVLALRYKGDVEEVKALAGRLVAALKQNDYENSLKTFSEKLTATEADFPQAISQVRRVAEIGNDRLAVHWVSNALKTSLKVLGDNMPSVTEARQYESKTAQFLKDGSEASERLQSRAGQKLVIGPKDYIDKVMEKSRQLE